MIVATAAHLRHGDVIEVRRGSQVIRGEIIQIARDGNGLKTVCVAAEDGKVTGCYLQPSQEVELISMADRENAAVSRNHRHNWPACDMREVFLEES